MSFENAAIYTVSLAVRLRFMLMNVNVSLMPISLYQKILLKILSSHLLLFSLVLHIFLLNSHAPISIGLNSLSLYSLEENPV